MLNVTTVLPHNLLQTNSCIRHNFSTQVFRKRAARFHIFWPPKEARKCSAAQGQHSEVVPRAFWRLVSKSCDECKGSFARGCEAKRWSHWTCSSLGTIFQPIRTSLWGLIMYQMSNAFVILKMCYVHNQWYDISYATLYIYHSIFSLYNIHSYKFRHFCVTFREFQNLYFPKLHKLCITYVT